MCPDSAVLFLIKKKRNSTYNSINNAIRYFYGSLPLPTKTSDKVIRVYLCRDHTDIMKRHLTYRSNVFKLRVRPHQYSLVYTKNCSIRITEQKNNECIVLPEGTISFIERHLNLEICINKKREGEPYVVHTLSDNALKRLITILTPVIGTGTQETSGGRRLEDKIHWVSGEEVNEQLFDSLKEGSNHVSDLYKLAYLISKAERPEKIYWSLCVSASRYFSDRVRALLDSDLSRKWRLSCVSEALSMSEISVRKKLEAEKTSFYQILLDARMQKSARLILDENHHINKVSTMVGMSSSSYFIKTFSSYYGMTPKQFYLYYKCSKSKV